MTEQIVPKRETAAARPPVPAGLPLRRRLLRLARKPRFAVPGCFVVLFCAMAIVPGAFAGWFGHGNPHACDLANSGAGPRAGHPFGFDIQGCDLYSNVIYGARASLSIGLLTTAGALLIAIMLGGLAGYYGGLVDSLISRLMDVFFGFPVLVGMIVILETFNVHNIATVSAVLIMFNWPVMTRIMRGSVLATVNLEYVTAARGLGASTWRILTRHVLPNAIGPVAVLASLNVGGVITAESALTFLGVGLQAPEISWGVQLNTAQQYFTTHLNLLIFPALFLSVAVLSFVLLGDAARDSLDPNTR